MPITVHKVLFHGCDLIREAILPIGQLSEEAQEARNKEIRRYRELFTRKTSRTDTNSDLIRRLLISSDPYISSLRKTIKKPTKTISRDVLPLLNIQHVDGEEEDDNHLSSSDSD